MSSNTRSTLRRRGGSMAGFDRLPRDLRHWLKHAALPWSARSAERIWERHKGNPAAALHALAEAERRTLARDARQVWGRDHPAAQG